MLGNYIFVCIQQRIVSPSLLVPWFFSSLVRGQDDKG